MWVVVVVSAAVAAVVAAVVAAIVVVVLTVAAAAAAAVIVVVTRGNGINNDLTVKGTNPAFALHVHSSPQPGTFALAGAKQ